MLIMKTAWNYCFSPFLWLTFYFENTLVGIYELTRENVLVLHSCPPLTTLGFSKLSLHLPPPHLREIVIV